MVTQGKLLKLHHFRPSRRWEQAIKSNRSNGPPGLILDASPKNSKNIYSKAKAEASENGPIVLRRQLDCWSGSLHCYYAAVRCPVLYTPGDSIVPSRILHITRFARSPHSLRSFPPTFQILFQFQPKMTNI